VSEKRRRSARPRRQGLGGARLSADSPLLGGSIAEQPIAGALAASAGAEDVARTAPSFDPRADQYAAPPEVTPEAAPGREGLHDLRDLLPAGDGDRSLDDWGRSERVLSMIDPLLNFYYRYWFRVEAEGVENVPSQGGALLVSNHSGALPPDAPMIMQAIRNEHPHPRPLYILGENWFKGFPGVGMLTAKLGLVGAHPENAQRLLREEGRLAIVFPEGQKGSRKVLWQRYRLRRFGRGGFVRTAIRAGVPIVPIAVVGAEEAMPIFAHLRPLQRISGLIYFPLNHAFPQFGLAAALMYLPAKFRIRFLEPVDMSEHDPEVADDTGAIQSIAEEIRARIQMQLDSMLADRDSVWLG
jgi:1-acyl-sn-glycerol-3-phosphate acyltransferase